MKHQQNVTEEQKKKKMGKNIFIYFPHAHYYDNNVLYTKCLSSYRCWGYARCMCDVWGGFRFTQI